MRAFVVIGVAMALVGTTAGGAAGAAGEAVQEAVLTQTPCLFLESEIDPKAYRSTRPEDCVAVNEATRGERRLKTLRLRPGRTIFRVTNRNVPYELGFWLRGEGLSRAWLPSVSGGGITTGATREYVVDLESGRYVYSCPLNPTPDYPLVVEERAGRDGPPGRVTPEAR